jgi:tetratricopeptide (TPR) repeat protein
MKHFHAVPLLLALALPAAFAADPCNDTCKSLMHEGQVLQAQGQNGPAYAKYKAASEAAPQASVPLSSTAALMYTMSIAARAEQADKLRAGARDMAAMAARLSSTDPLAQEVLRLLDDGPAPPLHAPSPELAKQVQQAELMFAQRRYPEALALYQQVMRADPAYSSAWVYAGDCYYAQKDWVQAEALFRRATEIEAANVQAWRFLSDALAAQGKQREAETALEAGIGADPSQRPNWSKLAALRAGASLPLQHLGLRRGFQLTRDANGKYTIGLDEWVLKTPDTPDTAMRLSLAAAETNQRVAAGGKPVDAYEAELAAWRLALKVADELKASTGKDPSDPALLRMQAFARDGQLEPAVLLLLFRQAYRPALEAWLAAHPGGVKTFIDRYGLQP